MKSLIALLVNVNLAAAIWPIPKSYSSGECAVFINQNTQFEYVPVDGAHQAEQGAISSSAVVHAAIERTTRDLFEQNLDPWKFYPRDTAYAPSADGAATISKVSLGQTHTDPENCHRNGDCDESYTIKVSRSGEASISAKSSIGLVRGLTSFTQLFFSTEAGSAWTKLAPIEIDDEPKFAHRGLNLDVSRHFLPLDDIKRTIDSLAFNKFNRLHLHVTDSQSWPLEIPAIPELSAKGAYRPDWVYTVDDLTDLQEYATLQGVQVITEIDSPGHTSSVSYSHPELIAAFDMQPDWETYAAEPPSGTLKLNSTKVDEFMKAVYEDLLPRIHPYSSYFHSGGDEVKAAAYKLDNTVNSGKIKVITPFLQKFVNKLHRHIRKAGLKPIVWEEMLLDWGLDLGDDVLIQTWLSDASVLHTVNKGYKALAGNYNYWYLDCGFGDWIGVKPKDTADFWPFPDWCDPYKNWKVVYAYDPLSGIPEDKQHLVVGGEVHSWNEQTDRFNLDSKLWPRVAAAGEVLWSGAKDENGHNRSQILAGPRLSEMRERLNARGVAASPIQMPYCLMYPDSCIYPT